jgi:glycosyltransferase involved in cell wall biosynthesis
MKNDKKAIIFMTSDPVFDQRANKIAQSLSLLNYSVTLWGINRNEVLASDSMLRYAPKNKKGPLFYWETGMAIKKHLKFNNYDLIWTCDPDTLWAVFPKKQKSLIIYDSHELFDEVPELANKFIKKLIWRKIESYFARKSDVRITVSKPIADILKKRFKKPVFVLSNMPLLHAKPIIEEKTNAIIYQGAINKGRNIKELIDAMAVIPNWELWIAGHGDLTEELRKYIDKLPNKSQIKWFGMLPYQELMKLTTKASIGYNGLNIKDSKSYEFSLANKFFDYILAETPVITANTITYQEYLNQYNVGWTEEHNLPELLFEITQFPQNIKEKTIACRLASNEWNWEKQWQKISLCIP